jgi:hypothetical protein
MQALHLGGSSSAWVGCGNGAGLHRTDDGGQSFAQAHSSGNLYVFDLREDSQGRLLACGHDYDGSGDGVLLYRLEDPSDSTQWEALLRYG